MTGTYLHHDILLCFLFLEDEPFAIKQGNGLINPFPLSLLRYIPSLSRSLSHLPFCFRLQFIRFFPPWKFVSSRSFPPIRFLPPAWRTFILCLLLYPTNPVRLSTGSSDIMSQFFLSLPTKEHIWPVQPLPPTSYSSLTPLDHHLQNRLMPDIKFRST